MPKIQKSNPISKKKKEFEKLVEQGLPEFAKAISQEGAEAVVFTQAAFGYSVEESIIFNAAIKYAGLYKKEVRIIP